MQRETIPHLLEGRDLVGQAATGTGKTAAFALPLLHSLDDRPRPPSASALVLVPTRELAMQVSEAIFKYGRQLGVKVVPVYGGQPIYRQLQSLERGVHVVVGTPGRVIDHLGRGSLDVDGIRTVVLDEADEMLDMGFAEDIETILDALPTERQTVLFSATMPPRITGIAKRFLDRSGARHRGRNDQRRPPGADHAAGLHRPARPQAGGARADPRHRDAGGRARLLPHTHRGRHADRDDERPRLSCRSVARRHGPGPA